MNVFLAVVAAVSIGQTADMTHVDTFNGGAASPARLAPAPGGGVYVTDPPNASVVEYDAVGAVANTYPIAEIPVGLAVHPDGRVFISRLDGQVGIYDASFGFLGLVDPAPFAMIEPNDVAIHPTTGEVYVADSAGHQILVFDGTTGLLARLWGVEGYGLSEFQSPQAIALDPALDHVIVADVDNFRMQVFDTAGILQFKFGYKTLYAPSGQVAWFARTEGVAVDSCSNIYVADALMGTVRAFSPEGAELDANFAPLATFGTGAGELRLPCDLAIDTADRVYVASQNNGAVEVYDATCTAARLATPGLQPVAGVRGGSQVGGSAVPGGPILAPIFLPDNPGDIVTVMNSGGYDRVLDINHDRVVDIADLEIAVSHFGAGTVDDFLNGDYSQGAQEYSGPYVPPHMLPIDAPIICGRCHSMDGLPEGGMLTVAGQENLCRSCHMDGGRAMMTAMDDGSDQMTHVWGVAADSGISDGPNPADAYELELHLDNNNVRCGTCHDPHGDAEADPFLRAPVRRGQLCGSCHRDQVAEWLHAGHADEQADPWSHYDWALPSRSACRKCHSGNGFIGFSNGLADADQDGSFRVLDCAVCHAAHGKPQDEDLLRIFDDVTLPGDVTFTDQGSNATCMTCHNGRRAPDDGGTPHYALGGVMLEGINANEFGATLTNSRHTSVAMCVDCHMAPGPAAGNPGAGKVGGHSFNLVVHDPADPDFGFENLNGCNVSGCHGDTGALTTINRPAFGDFDGNGSIDGVQDEVQGLMDLVLAAIEDAGAVYLGYYPYWDYSAVVDDPPGFLELVKDSVWNWEYVKNSGDLGIHNTDYAVGVLQVTYEVLTGDTVPDADLRYLSPGFGETIVEIVGVNGGAPVEPGGAFTVDFTIEDETGAGVMLDALDRLQLYVSGPSYHYQRVIEVDNDETHFIQNGTGSFTYVAVDPFPSVYAAPVNDSAAFGVSDGEWTGLPLVDGTYTVLIEARRTFGDIRKAGDATFDFIVANDPFSPPAMESREVVARDTCNNCHNDLQIHGSNRFAVTGCVICHNAGAEDLITDPVTTPGVTIDFGNMIHRLHRGHDLPTVTATENSADPYRYEIIGFRESVHDFSDVGFPVIPDGVMHCDACHAGAAQGGDIYTSSGRAVCAGCHSDIDFVAGTILDDMNTNVQDGLLTEADLGNPAYRVAPGGITHAFGDDTGCFGCHNPGMFADIEVAHQHPTNPAKEGTNPTVVILGVAGMTGGGGTYFQAGDLYEVTFKLTDDSNDPLFIVPGDTSVLDRLYFTVAGPTVLYQTIIEAERPWNSGNLGVPAGNWVDHGDGTYTFISEEPWPANYPAQLNTFGEPPADQIFPFAGGWGQQYTAGGTPLDNGTYSIVGYGRRVTPTDGEREPLVASVFDVPFGAADPIVPYAGTVETASCNACHGELAFHGNQRWGIETCVTCHTAGTQDGGTFESVDFRIMIHKLHNARNLTNLPYELAGFSGIADFSHLLITSMPGEAAECHECHGTDAWKNPPVRTNMRTWMVACTSCHDAAEVAAHADTYTTPGTFTEQCATCHGEGAAYSVETVHAAP